MLIIEDLERSFLFFKQSADSMDVDSMGFVGIMYEGELGTTVDYEKALLYYNKAAKYDNPVALNNIGSIIQPFWIQCKLKINDLNFLMV